MFAGFLETDATCKARFKTSGTTATLVVVVGWEVFVANVGDSEAYLDTGKQVGTQPNDHDAASCV
jgi:serine/threonine protein phosphatase PrpC